MKKLLSVILIIIAFQAIGQDMQFTQFYAAQTYLNPALTGNNVCSRLSSNYRNQWPSVQQAFVSYIFSYDHYAPSLSSGFGVLFTNDKAGSGNLRSTTISLLYSYELALTRKWAFRSGFQITETIRDINFYDLVFGDQLAREGASTSLEPPAFDKVMYFDVSTGGILYSKKHWIGYSAHHLNLPNQSLLRGESPVPVKHSIHAGTKIPIKEESKGEWNEFLTPAINYKAQGKFDQVDLGLYYSYGVVDLGAWYRGIPIFKSYKKGYANNDAIALLAGLTVDRLKFAYSYDFTISRLIGSTGGSHEISLSYEFCKLKKKKRKKTKALLVPCPKF